MGKNLYRNKSSGTYYARLNRRGKQTKWSLKANKTNLQANHSRGRALSRLERVDPETLAKRIPEYRKIIGFRNILAHGYDIVDEASLCDFAKNRVQDLLNQVHSYE